MNTDKEYIHIARTSCLGRVFQLNFVPDCCFAVTLAWQKNRRERENEFPLKNMCRARLGEEEEGKGNG